MAFKPKQPKQGTTNGTYLAGPGLFVPQDDEGSNTMGAIIDPKTGKPFLKRGQYDSFPIPNVITQASLISSAWRTYMHQWDEAIYKNRSDALAMRRDSFFRGLLQERKLASTGLNWEIQVDNEKDPTEKALKDGLTQIINRISRFQQMRYYLAEKIWYGRYGAQLRLGWKELNLPTPTGKSGGGTGFKSSGVKKRRALCVIPGYPDTDDPGHVPINGDKIGHSWDHTAYLMVNAAYDVQLPDSPPAPPPIWSTFAKAQPLKGELREQFIIDKHEVDDADFFHAEMAEGLHGVGVRSVMYFLWWLRDEWLSNISDIIERTAWGIRLWYFQGGNPQSQNAVQQAAERNIGKFNILVPKFPGPHGESSEGMEVIDLPTQGLEFVKSMIDWIDQIQERFMVGQSMSGGADNDSGLGGSGRARFAANTKYQIVKFDCANTDDTFTTDLVGPIKKYTYPEWDEIPARFRSKIDDPDAKNWIAGVKSIVEMGGAVPANPVYDRAGIPMPEKGDITLSTLQQLEEKYEIEKKAKLDDAKLDQERAEEDHKRQMEMEEQRQEGAEQIEEGRQDHKTKIEKSKLEAKRSEHPPRKDDKKGEKGPAKKPAASTDHLGPEDYEKVKQLHDSGLSQEEIAERMGVSRQRIGQILNMERETHGQASVVEQQEPVQEPSQIGPPLSERADAKAQEILDGPAPTLLERMKSWDDASKEYTGLLDNHGEIPALPMVQLALLERGDYGLAQLYQKIALFEKPHNRSIGVDFDGRIATQGQAPLEEKTPREGTKEALELFRSWGITIVIWTSNREWKNIPAWMDKYGLAYDYLNEFPKEENGSRKVDVGLYLDDQGEGDPDSTWPELIELVRDRFGIDDPEIRQPIDSKKGLFDAAPKAQEELMLLLSQLGMPILRMATLPVGIGGIEDSAAKPGGRIFIADVKTQERSKEKVARDYKGDWSNLLDVVRASVVCSNMMELRAALTKFQSIAEVLQLKDRFSNPADMGYRDINTKIRLPSGMIAEVLFHLKPIFIAWQKEHLIYQSVRTIKAQMAKEGRRKMTDGEKLLARRSKQQGKELLAKAWQEAQQDDPERMSLEGSPGTVYYNERGEPDLFERPSYLTVVEMIDRIKRLDSASGKYKELVRKLLAFLQTYPDMRRHIPGEDYLWLTTGV